MNSLNDAPSQQNSANFLTTEDLENLKNHRKLNEEVSKHACDNCTWLHSLTRIFAILYTMMIPILVYKITNKISYIQLHDIIKLMIEKDNWIFNIMIVSIFAILSFLIAYISKRLWV